MVVDSLRADPSPEPTPSRPDIGLLIVAADDWSSRRMARHQLVARMTRRFHMVWMNPAHTWRNTLHVARKGRPEPVSGPDEPMVHRAELWLPLLFRPRSLAHPISRCHVARLSR